VEFHEGVGSFRNSSSVELFDDNPYSFFGFRNPATNSFFLATLKRIEKPDAIFNQISDCLSNDSNFSSNARLIADELDLAAYDSVAIAFCTHATDQTSDPYELPLLLSGTLLFGSEAFSLRAVCFDLFGYLSAGKIFGILNAIYIVSSFYAWHSI
jgi:hypothetical protein